MNVIQIYQAALAYMDAPNTPRFPDWQVEQLITSASRQIVIDLFPGGKVGAGFQLTQAMRDKLYSLIKLSGEIVPVTIGGDSAIPLTSLSTFIFTIGLKIEINGNWYDTDPLTYSERREVEKDPFRRPDYTKDRTYRIEYEDGNIVLWGKRGTLQGGKYEYIAEPQQVKLGTDVTAGASIQTGLNVICLEGGAISYVKNNVTVVEDKVEGEEFTTSTTTTVNSGIFKIGFINPDTPRALHEDIALLTSKFMLGSIGKAEIMQPVK